MCLHAFLRTRKKKWHDLLSHGSHTVKKQGIPNQCTLAAILINKCRILNYALNSCTDICYSGGGTQRMNSSCNWQKWAKFPQRWIAAGEGGIPDYPRWVFPQHVWLCYNCSIRPWVVNWVNAGQIFPSLWKKKNSKYPQTSSLSIVNVVGQVQVEKSPEWCKTSHFSFYKHLTPLCAWDQLSSY